MKKYNKILITMIIGLCIATIFNMVIGILCYDSIYYNGHWSYGYGGCSISSMVFSFIALILTIITINPKMKNKIIFAISTIIATLISWILCLCALFSDYPAGGWIGYGTTEYLWIIAFICLFIMLVLSCVYLGLSETARKKSLKQTKQELVQLAQASTPTLGIDTGANELKGLKSLLDCGILSNDEFTAQKAKILASMGVILQPKQKAQPTFIGSYVADNGIVITLNEKDFAIRKSNSANALVGTYVTHLNAQCITLTRDGGGTMSLQIKDENHLVDSTGNVYVKE